MQPQRVTSVGARLVYSEVFVAASLERYTQRIMSEDTPNCDALMMKRNSLPVSIFLQYPAYMHNQESVFRSISTDHGLHC